MNIAIGAITKIITESKNIINPALLFDLLKFT